LMLWGVPICIIARELERTPEAVYQRAARIGLPNGCPPGHEYLTAAAKRTGFGDTGMLRRILKWAKVRIRHTNSLEPAQHARFFVEPEAVDRAVAAWLKTETPEAAARRLGVSTATVMSRLQLSGLRLPPKVGRKKHWRIPSTTIERAMTMVVRRGRGLVVLREAA